MHISTNIIYIMTNWRQYVNKRKRSIFMLEIAMKKSLMQAGFNEVKWFSRDLNHARKMDRVITKFFSAFKIFAIRTQFSRWKHQSRSKVT